MGIVNDLVDPYYRSRAKNKIKALEAKIESYKIQCEIYEEEIDQLNNAKVFSLKVVKDMEIYINSIANKPKELVGVIVTPDSEKLDFESDLNSEWKEYKHGRRKSIFAAVGLMASMFFLPAAVLTVPMSISSLKNEKKNNMKVIHECEVKMGKIDKELKKIQNSSSEIVTEKEFLVIYSNSIKESMDKLEKTGIRDYSQFSIEQKNDLGTLVNSTKTLIKRLDGR